MLRMMTLLLFLAAAVTKDIQEWRIPNSLLLAGACNGIILQYVVNGWTGMCMVFCGFLLPFAVGLLFFALSMIGAGDIKLLMATGIYMGPERIMQVTLWSCVLGAIMAVEQMAACGIFKVRMRYAYVYLMGLVDHSGVKKYVALTGNQADKPWLIHFSVPIIFAVILCLVIYGESSLRWMTLI